MPELPGWDSEPIPADELPTGLPWHIARTGLRRLHGRDLLGDGVRVAVIDSGVDRAHADLSSARIKAFDVRGKDFSGSDALGHGTAMVGVIVGAQGAVAPQAEIASIRAVAASGRASSKAIADGVEIAMGLGADVISISVVDEVPEPLLTKTISAAIHAGTLVVAAAGNDEGAVLPDVYPASLTPVIAVTAADVDANVIYPAPPSWVDLAAPGMEILTTTLEGRSLVTGTSPATAFTAGVCALILGLAPRGARRRELAGHVLAFLRKAGRPIAGSTGPGDCVLLRPVPTTRLVEEWITS